MAWLAYFPGLREEGYHETSPATTQYNCFAWAASDPARWWEPDPWGDYYWPAGAPRERNLPAFVKAYEALGFRVCSDGSLEPGFEKVALYAIEQKASHAVRQLPNGRWTSKLGQEVDIEHALNGLVGAQHGQLAVFLSRPRRSPQPFSAPAP